MAIYTRPFARADLDSLVALTLAAFEPVFASFARIMGPNVFPVLYPDWHKTQTDLVVEMSRSEKAHLCVAEVDGQVVGFIAYELYDNQTGQVLFLAVHPEYQRHGVGTELNLYALQRLREGGAKVAWLNTGGDESHAPARACYEKAGYRPFPQVWYYQDL